MNCRRKKERTTELLRRNLVTPGVPASPLSVPGHPPLCLGFHPLPSSLLRYLFSLWEMCLQPPSTGILFGKLNYKLSTNHWKFSYKNPLKVFLLFQHFSFFQSLLTFLSFTPFRVIVGEWKYPRIIYFPLCLLPLKSRISLVNPGSSHLLSIKIPLPLNP